MQKSVMKGDNLNLFQSAKWFFEEKFSSSEKATTFTAPASIILLGDHTHYNDGLIISAAIDRYSTAVIRKRDDQKIVVQCGDPDNNNLHTTLNELSSEDFVCGENYFGHLIQSIIKTGYLKKGFDCAIINNIPLCIGLGRLTSQLSALLRAINIEFNLKLSEEEMINISRESEFNSIGKISNMAHHYTIVHAELNSILKIDLRDKSIHKHSFNSENISIAICDTSTRILNARDICNERISECEVGVQGLRLYIWGIKNLRDVKLDFLEKHYSMIPRRVYKRVYYNVNERLRVERAFEAMLTGDMEKLSKIICDSHRGLRENYELGSDALDFLSNTACGLKNIYGSKLISCSSVEGTINLVSSENANHFIKYIEAAYNKKYGRDLITYKINLTAGIENSFATAENYL